MIVQSHFNGGCTASVALGNTLHRLLLDLAKLVGVGLWAVLLGACQSVGDVDAGRSVATGALPRGAGQFVFRDWSGPPITVWTYLPEGKNLEGLPVVVVMHGVDRDGDRYRDEWIKAARDHGLIILAPTFSDADFPRAAGYNLGNIFEGNSGARKNEDKWSFSAIDLIFGAAIKRIGGAQQSYALYGHSAGAQFVHRYAYFKPDTRADLFIVANAGWYTMPDFGTAFPYGLAGSTVPPDQLKLALQRDLVVLLGDRDTDETDPNLRQTPEAMAQGPHRFARGRAFFEAGRDGAAAAGVGFGWRQVTVPGAHHSNALMAPAAAALVRNRDLND